MQRQWWPVASWGSPWGAGWPHADTVGGLVVGDCGAFAWPDESGVVEIGYGLAEPFRGRGYATEALAGVCQWLFAEAGAAVIIATGVEAGNVASRRVLEKLGFARTGDSFRLALTR